MPNVYQLAAQAPEETVTLGDVTLCAEEITLKTSCPVNRKTLADGSELLTVLPEQACTLTLSGRAVRTGHTAGTLASALHAAMHARTAFAFSLEGCSFTGMRITACDLLAKLRAQTADCTIVLVGTMEVPA